MKMVLSRERSGSPVPNTLETGEKTKSTVLVSKPTPTETNTRVIGKIT